MNTAARAIAQGNLTTTVGIRALVFSKTMLCTASLITFILLSGLGLIFTKEKARCLTSNLSNLQHVQESLQIKQGQLLLEEKTLTAQGRLEAIAQSQLHMEVPKTTKIISSSIS